jgi:aldehyde dehydrogenase family protein
MGRRGVGETIDPATGQILTTVAKAAAADVELAVKAARTAFDGEWSLWSPAQRQPLLFGHRICSSASPSAITAARGLLLRQGAYAAAHAEMEAGAEPEPAAEVA